MAIYMKLTNISGDVTDQHHAGWIELEGYHFGISREVEMELGQATNRDISTPRFYELELRKRMDKSSVLIFGELLDNSVIDSCTIEVCHTGPSAQVHSQYILNNVLISRYEDSCDQDGVSQEFISFAYTKIQRKHTPYDSLGKPGSPLVAGYNLATATKS